MSTQLETIIIVIINIIIIMIIIIITIATTKVVFCTIKKIIITWVVSTIAFELQAKLP